MNRTVLKKVPKLIISLNSSVNRFVLNEVNKLRIPIINLTDTNNNKKYFYMTFTERKLSLTALFSNLLVSLFTKKRKKIGENINYKDD